VTPVWRNSYRVLIGKLKGKGLLEKHNHRWRGIILKGVFKK
jgi:hypothetical protein